MDQTQALQNSIDERATRFNAGKPRFDLIDTHFEEGVARVLTFGASKYADDNWKLSYGTEKHEEFTQGCYASLRRHLHAMLSGEKLDPESGIEHIYHVACNTMFIAYYSREQES